MTDKNPWSSLEHNRVFISKLTLTDFRCYQHTQLKLGCDHPLVVLTGPNGAGKTNILEALSYMAPGRGLRRSSLTDVARQSGPGSWAAAADLMVGDEMIKIGTGIEPTPGGETAKRLVRVDGENAQNSNVLGERWSVGWLTPQMDRLFIEGPSSRRRFLDRLVLGLFPDHSRQVGAYERVMRERNKLLAEQGNRADSAWLSALEARMAEHGIAAAIARLEFAGQLAGQLDEAEDGPFPKALLAIDGWLESMLADGTAPVDAELAFRERLKTGRMADGSNSRANVGIHKTDLVVTHAPKNMRADLCSTGEQKALLVALVLANAKLQAALKGRAPLMLMDEVAAHLDIDRRIALFEALASLGSQCWLTGTDKSLFEGLSGKAEFFEVSDGKIQPSGR